jgi:UDPglucose--hexose-1-phosphate uridylyltransferase
MHKQILTKPDGRRLILYSQNEFTNVLEAPAPHDIPAHPNPHMRWHPLRGEFVTYASFRQERTFLPPPEYNPLAPMHDPASPTELPAGDYSAAVFENGFPSMTLQAHDAPTGLPVPTRPANGTCEVVVYTQDRNASLGSLPLSHVRLVLEIWADRYRELGSNPEIQYVMPFENRGVEVGVTLHHPHGQIYAYPFIPAIPATELANQLAYYEQHQTGMLEDLIRAELQDQRRVIVQGQNTTAFVPAFARYSYEVWIAPNRGAASVADLSNNELNDFALTLKTMLMKFDALWNRPFPYVMVLHQAPTDKKPHPEAHFHIEFYPPYRTKDKLKFLAGTEIGAGMFTSDSLPEEKAAELKAVNVMVPHD